MANVALEWQAKSMGLRSKEMLGACPLEGLVRSVASSQEIPADLRLTSNT
jgi:hypothetical protein